MQYPNLLLQHDVKHLQHTSKKSKTFEAYACNMRFRCNVTLLLGRMEAHRCGAQHPRGGRRRRMELTSAPAEALRWSSTCARPREQNWARTARGVPGVHGSLLGEHPASTPGERPAASEHLLPGEHEQASRWRAPLAGEHEHHLMHQQLASTTFLQARAHLRVPPGYGYRDFFKGADGNEWTTR
jgi:hypothetical protein